MHWFLLFMLCSDRSQCLQPTDIPNRAGNRKYLDIHSRYESPRANSRHDYQGRPPSKRCGSSWYDFVYTFHKR